jgi:hypothetical protein
MSRCVALHILWRQKSGKDIEGAFTMDRRRRGMHSIHFKWETLKGKRHFGDLEVDGKRILNI